MLRTRELADLLRRNWGRHRPYTRKQLIEVLTEDARRRLPRIDRLINERAQWRAHIDANTEGGRVALCRSGMDCDCVTYTDARVIPAPVSVVAWLREFDQHCEWLDGPESTWFDKPSRVTEGHESRDLVLEAYEDGHPHVIHL
jgi:hypothetical protein